MDIPRRRHDEESGQNPSDLLAAFRAALPIRSPRKPVQLHPRELQAKREALFPLLRESTDIVHKRSSSVEVAFGGHGFSSSYDTGEHKAQLKQRAQVRAKKIKRKATRLDWGEPYVSRGSFVPGLLLRPEDQARAILQSKFNTQTQSPITFINELNDRQLYGKFEFISSIIPRENIIMAPQQANNGCKCVNTCRPGTCDCLGDDHGTCAQNKVVPYKEHSAGLVVLSDEFITENEIIGRKSEIVECNESCGCGPTCWNRVVQKGRMLPLEIFMTKKCGFGKWT